MCMRIRTERYCKRIEDARVPRGIFRGWRYILHIMRQCVGMLRVDLLALPLLRLCRRCVMDQEVKQLHQVARGL